MFNLSFNFSKLGLGLSQHQILLIIASRFIDFERLLALDQMNQEGLRCESLSGCRQSGSK